MSHCTMSERSYHLATSHSQVYEDELEVQYDNIIHQKKRSIVSFQIHHNLVIDFLVQNINAYIQIATIHLLVIDISLISNQNILIMDFLFSYVLSDFSCS